MSVVAACGVLAAYLYYLWDSYSYWRRKGIIGPTPWPIVGNYWSVLIGRKKEADLLEQYYHDFQNEKFVGLYKGTQPVLLLRDPELMEQIYVKDIHLFMNNVSYVGSSMLNESLLAMQDYDIWKILRKTVSSTLTKSKIVKTMPKAESPLSMYIDYLESMVANKNEHDVILLQHRFVLDVIGAMTLGSEFGNKSTDKGFSERTFVLNKQFVAQKMVHQIAVIFPFLLALVMPVIRRVVRPVYNFYYTLIMSVLDSRKEEKEIKDTFLHFLEDTRGVKHNKSKDDTVSQLTIDNGIIIQQCIITWIANYLNTLNAISLTLYEIALDPHVQDKVHEEIDKVLLKDNDEVCLESVFEMKYLSMVIDEAMRKYTTNGFLSRISTTKYTLPGTNVRIDRGVAVLISNQGVQHDPNNFLEPNKFVPERFSLYNKPKIGKCQYMAFGFGPRDCVGQRYAKVVLLIGLTALLRKFKVLPIRTKMLKQRRYRIGERIPEGVWLRIEKRS